MITANKLSRHNGKASNTGKTQDWSIGNEVKVGFLTLTVVAYNGVYELVSAKGVRYEFEPHVGLTRK